MAVAYFRSPIGLLQLTADQRKLRGLRLIDKEDKPAAPNGITESVCAQLEAYFAGTLQAFSFAMLPHGTAFQVRVWAALSRVPYGKVVTYGQLASAIGQPTACRAVANALGANPILLALPCHRVVAATGLGGFSSGMPAKRQLLRHEGILSADSDRILKKFFFTFP